MTAHKILLVVIDGLSDRPCPELGNLTPLEAAKKPVLDQLAREGICGIMDTIAPGIGPGLIPHILPCWAMIRLPVIPEEDGWNARAAAFT